MAHSPSHGVESFDFPPGRLSLSTDSGVPSIRLNVPVLHADAIYRSFVETLAVPVANSSPLRYSLNPAYFQLLRSLKLLREIFQISDAAHHFAVLGSALKVIKSQCKEIEAKSNNKKNAASASESTENTSWLEIDAFQDSDCSIIPLLLATAEFFGKFLYWPPELGGHSKNSSASSSTTSTGGHDKIHSSSFSSSSVFHDFSAFHPFPDSSFLLLEDFCDVLKHCLSYYHEYPSELIAQLMKIYFYFLSFSRALRKAGAFQGKLPAMENFNVYNQCEKDIRILIENSMKTYYLSFFPIPKRESSEKIEENLANQRISLKDFFSDEKNGKSSAIDFSQLEAEILSEFSGEDGKCEKLKKMISWSVKEWEIFTAGLSELISVEIIEFLPAFENIRCFQFSTAEVALKSVLEQFQLDLQEFDGIRDKAGKGLDEIGMSVIECLSTIRWKLMRFHREFTINERRLLMKSFPNLTQLALNSFTRWLQNQSWKFSHWRERLISSDSWIPIDPEQRIHYSESLNDQFAILSSLLDGFFSHLKRLFLPRQEIFQSLLKVLNDGIIRYGRYLIDICGEIPQETIPMASIHVKYKQSGVESGNVFSQLKKKITSGGNSSASATSSSSVGPASVAQLTGGRSFAGRPFLAFLVKISCAAAAAGKMTELARELSQQINEILAIERAEREENLWFGIEIPSWEAWEIPIPSEAQLRPLIHPENYFIPAEEEFSSSIIPRLVDFISLHVIWIQFRDLFLQQLYFPSAKAGGKWRNSPQNHQFDEIMKNIYGNVEKSIFPAIVKGIFTRFLSAWRFTILFGRRVIEAEDVQNILRDDLECIREMFEAHCDEDLLESQIRPLELLLAYMQRPTDQLMDYCQCSGLEIDHDTLVRIISLRSGTKAGKFVKKEREKQKALEKSSGSSSSLMDGREK